MPFDVTKLYTRPLANKGIELPLMDPVTGQDSGGFIYLRGQDSDGFRALDAAVMRETMELYNKDKDAGLKFRVESEKRLIAGLIIGWTDNHPCTAEQALELVENCPQIAQQITEEAGNRSRFFKHALKSSTSEPLPSSD